MITLITNNDAMKIFIRKELISKSFLLKKNQRVIRNQVKNVSSSDNLPKGKEAKQNTNKLVCLKLKMLFSLGRLQRED